jgi:predicted metal-dependent HD superfamily phosphohydrolase
LPDSAWRTAVSALGGVPVETDVVARYSEPHRRYHGLAHVRAVVRDAVTLVPLTEREKAVLVLAACAHDVVYQAMPTIDELNSAAWARTWLGRSRLAFVADRVCDLVLATTMHDADPDDAVACALLDADLAILGSPTEEYDAYVSAVRQEYSAVAEDVWRSRRSEVLQSFLDRERIFLTSTGRDRWESAARRNVARELGTLR